MKALILIMIALPLTGCAHSISPGVHVTVVTVGEGEVGYQQVNACPRYVEFLPSYPDPSHNPEDYEELFSVF